MQQGFFNTGWHQHVTQDLAIALLLQLSQAGWVVAAAGAAIAAASCRHSLACLLLQSVLCMAAGWAVRDCADTEIHDPRAV